MELEDAPYDNTTLLEGDCPMAQGNGMPKQRASFYGYNTRPAPKGGGGVQGNKSRDYKGGTSSQIIETQKTHQGISVGKIKK